MRVKDPVGRRRGRSVRTSCKATSYKALHGRSIQGKGMNVPHIVVDTNVWVAAFRSKRGASWALINEIGSGAFDIHVSTPLVLEHEAVFHRQREPMQLSKAEVDELVDFHELGPKPSSFRRAALARIFWGASFCIESELPQRENERISTWVAHNLRDQVPSGMGDKIPVPRVERGGRPSSPGTDPSDVSRVGCPDRERAHRQGSRARSCVVSTDPEPIRSDETDKRSVLAQAAARVCSSEKALLGTALLGAGLLLRDERSGYGRTDSHLH